MIPPFSPAPPAALTFNGARVYSTQVQSIPNNADTAITFDTVRFDTGSYSNLAAHNTRLTAQRTAYYIIGGCVAISAFSTTIQLVVHVNGTDEIVSTFMQGGPTPFNAITNIETVYKLNANDYCELIIVQETGTGAKPTAVEAPLCPEFWIMLAGV